MSASIPPTGLGDFESIIAVKRDTPSGGHVHLGVGRLTVSGNQEAAFGIEIAHPDAPDGRVALFSLRLPTFAVMLECMMECFAIAQRIEAGTDETLKAARPEGREPDPEGDAPNPTHTTTGG